MLRRHISLKQSQGMARTSEFRRAFPGLPARRGCRGPRRVATRRWTRGDPVRRWIGLIVSESEQVLDPDRQNAQEDQVSAKQERAPTSLPAGGGHRRLRYRLAFKLGTGFGI
jgi:hypothetical protein